MLFQNVQEKLCFQILSQNEKLCLLVSTFGGGGAGEKGRGDSEGVQERGDNLIKS